MHFACLVESLALSKPSRQAALAPLTKLITPQQVWPGGGGFARCDVCQVSQLMAGDVGRVCLLSFLPGISANNWECGESEVTQCDREVSFTGRAWTPVHSLRVWIPSQNAWKKSALFEKPWETSLSKEKKESEVAQSCLILCNPVDYSQPGSSVHGGFQARVLEWVAVPFSRGSSQPKDWTPPALQADA